MGRAKEYLQKIWLMDVGNSPQHTQQKRPKLPRRDCGGGIAGLEGREARITQPYHLYDVGRHPVIPVGPHPTGMTGFELGFGNGVLG